MKTGILVTGLLLQAICSMAQQVNLSTQQTDSLHSSYKKHKTAGLVLLPVGGAAFIAGAVVVIGASLSEAGDDLGNGITELFGGTAETKKNYSGQYTTGTVMMVGGAVLAIVGTTQLVTARKIRKTIGNASLSFSPSSIPALKGFGSTTNVSQSTLSLKIPLGK